MAVLRLLLGPTMVCSCLWPRFDHWLNVHELDIGLVLLTALFAYLPQTSSLRTD